MAGVAADAPNLARGLRMFGATARHQRRPARCRPRCRAPAGSRRGRRSMTATLRRRPWSPWLLRDGLLHVGAQGGEPEGARYDQEHPHALDVDRRPPCSGRANAVQLPDVMGDPEYTYSGPRFFRRCLACRSGSRPDTRPWAGSASRADSTTQRSGRRDPASRLSTSASAWQTSDRSTSLRRHGGSRGDSRCRHPRTQGIQPTGDRLRSPPASLVWTTSSLPLRR